VQGYRRIQQQPVRPGGEFEPPVALTGNPGHNGAVFETHDELCVHRDGAAYTPHNPHEVRYSITVRHEVDHAGSACFSFKTGFKNQRIAAITSCRASSACNRCDQPSAVSRFAKQSSETGRAVEPGQAEPINRAVAADQRQGFAIADDCIIFNTTGHGLSMFQDGGRNAETTATRSSAVQRAWGSHDRSSDST
jgi:hypothetical protein